MPVSTYLKDTQKRIESKYHQVSQKIESKYEIIHRKLTSKFHREETEIESVRSTIHNLINKSTLSIENQIKSKRIIPILSKTSTIKVYNPYRENIDWTRGRFAGQIIQIIIREGKIIEKVFLTPKGNIISVKRSELGLRFR